MPGGLAAGLVWGAAAGLTAGTVAGVLGGKAVSHDVIGFFRLVRPVRLTSGILRLRPAAALRFRSGVPQPAGAAARTVPAAVLPPG